MASKSLGTLTIDLIAKVGGFTEGMSKAEREAKKKAESISKSLNMIGGAAASAITAAAGIGAAWTKEIAAMAVEIDKLARLSGSSTDEFQKLALGADTVGISSEKLADILKDVQDKVGDFMQTGGGAMADFFERIAPKVGVTADQFRRLSGPDALQLYVSSLEKAGLSQSDMVFYMEAIASDATALIPLLQKNGEAWKALGDEAEGYGAILDKDLIAASKALDVEMRKLDQVLLGVKNSIAKELIPALLGSAQGFREWLNEGNRVELLSRGIAAAFDLVSRTCTVIAASIRAVTMQFIALYQAGRAAFDVLTLDFKGAAENWGRAKIAAGMSVDALQDAVNAITRDRPVIIPVEGGVPGMKPLPRLSPRFTKPDSGANDALKSGLDAGLKLIERTLNQERELMEQRNRFLELYNDQGLFSIQGYYERQAAIRDEATRKQSAAYDDQIKALQDYMAKAAPKDRASAQEKINDLLDKQAKLQRDAGAAALEAGIKQSQAMRDYANTVADTNARLLELQGEVGKAAAIRFDLQNESLIKLFSAEGNQEMLDKVKRIRELSVAQAELNKISGDYSLIQGQLQIAEDRIALAQKMGTQGEIDGLVKLGEARRASYDQLKKIAEQYERIARASGDPQMILKADQLKLALEQLSAELDPLANKFNTMFADSASNAFSDFISGTKSAKDAFRSFIDDIMSQITRMVSQNLFQNLFGNMMGNSAGGGIGGWLAGLFGGGRASGGPVQPGKLYRVNEQGPELFKAANGDQFLMTGTQGGNVIPNHAMRGGSGQTVNVNINGYVKRETPNQIAMEVRRQSNLAAARFA